MNKALTCHWNLWSRNYMPKPENILCICLVDCIPQEKVEYNQQSLACYSKLLFFPKKLYWRRTSVIFQIILINKPNCLWDQHPSSNDLVYCVFFVAAAFSDGWQAGKVEAAVASAGFQLLLCRSGGLSRPPGDVPNLPHHLLQHPCQQQHQSLCLFQPNSRQMTSPRFLLLVLIFLSVCFRWCWTKLHNCRYWKLLGVDLSWADQQKGIFEPCCQL